LKLWNDEDHQNGQSLLKFLLEERGPSGWPMSLQIAVAFRELAACSRKPNLEDGFLMRVLSRMKERGHTSIEEFETICGELQVTETTAPQVCWDFYIPTYIKQDAENKKRLQIKVLETQFSLLKCRSVEKKLGVGPLASVDVQIKLFRRRVMRVPPMFLFCSSHGTSWESAWKQLIPAFDTFRGFFEFTFGFGSWRIFDSNQDPRCLVPHPHWMIVRRNENIEGVLFLTEEFKGNREFNLTVSKRDGLLKLSKIIRDVPPVGSTKAVIADAMRLYGQAMDARFNYRCLLGLWQIAEAITRSDSFGGESKKVARRIAALKTVRLVASGWEKTLINISSKRNDIVHKGIHDHIDNHEVNILKAVCSHSILWLIDMVELLPTIEHLEQYYRLKETPEKNLLAMKDCIRHIQNQRLAQGSSIRASR
jgi:hypothetical protein